MKHTFWRINLHVICKSNCRSRCKRCTQTWSFLADWKRLMLQKGFSHGFWCTHHTGSFFVSNSVCFWNKRKCFTLLSQSATFFSFSEVYKTYVMDFRNFYQEYKFDWVTLKKFLSHFSAWFPEWHVESVMLTSHCGKFPIN